MNDEKVRVELDEPGDVERRAVTRRALTVGGCPLLFPIAQRQKKSQLQHCATARGSKGWGGLTEVGRLEEPGDVLGLRVGRVGRRLLRHVEVEGAPLDEVLAVRADQLVRAEPLGVGGVNCFWGEAEVRERT